MSAYFILGGEPGLLQFNNKGFIEFKDKKSTFHMPPIAIIHIFGDMHVLMEFVHVWPCVVVGSSEEVGEEKHHCRMELWDVADVLKVVAVDGLIVEGVLVELGHDFL